MPRARTTAHQRHHKSPESYTADGARPVQSYAAMRTIIRSAFVLGALCAAPVIAAADPDTTKDQKDTATDTKKDAKDTATDAKKKAKDVNATSKQKSDNKAQADKDKADHAADASKDKADHAADAAKDKAK